MPAPRRTFCSAPCVDVWREEHDWGLLRNRVLMERGPACEECSDYDCRVVGMWRHSWGAGSEQWRHVAEDFDPEAPILHAQAVARDGRGRPLEVHHVFEVKGGPRVPARRRDLVVLCIQCHTRAHHPPRSAWPRRRAPRPEPARTMPLFEV